MSFRGPRIGVAGAVWPHPGVSGQQFPNLENYIRQIGRYSQL